MSPKRWPKTYIDLNSDLLIANKAIFWVSFNLLANCYSEVLELNVSLTNEQRVGQANKKLSWMLTSMVVCLLTCPSFTKILRNFVLLKYRFSMKPWQQLFHVHLYSRFQLPILIRSSHRYLNPTICFVFYSSFKFVQKKGVRGAFSWNTLCNTFRRFFLTPILLWTLTTSNA